MSSRAISGLVAGTRTSWNVCQGQKRLKLRLLFRRRQSACGLEFSARYWLPKGCIVSEARVLSNENNVVRCPSEPFDRIE